MDVVQSVSGGQNSLVDGFLFTCWLLTFCGIPVGVPGNIIPMNQHEYINNKITSKKHIEDNLTKWHEDIFFPVVKTILCICSSYHVMLLLISKVTSQNRLTENI